MSTKTFHNTSDKNIDIIGVGKIAPGESISITGEYLPPVALPNYPGLIETTDDEVEPAAHRAKAKKNQEAKNEQAV
jgi:hypothetical protein